MKLAVLFGGCSPEYSVSLQSAAAVLQNMDGSKYEAVMVGISKMGDWYSYTGPIENIKNDTWFDPEICTPAVVLPNRSESALLVFGQGAMQKIRLDAAFPVLHGQNGEDGTVQGLFELAGIPLVGCGVLASALCMDKNRAHKLVQAAGVAIPHSIVLERWINLNIVRAKADGVQQRTGSQCRSVRRLSLKKQALASFPNIILLRSRRILFNIANELNVSLDYLSGRTPAGTQSLISELANTEELTLRQVPSRFMRKFVCRLRLSEVSRQ